jgi:Mg2+/Co2+ transporter CorB
MMALNRYRLKHLVETGNRGARLTHALLAQTDRLLSVILICNNLVNAAAATLTAVATVQLFGENEYALAAGTATITFLHRGFCEITPKVIGATHPEKIAFPLAYILTPLLKLGYPFVWFTNLFVRVLLRALGYPDRMAQQETQLSLPELRTLVLEASHFIPQKHQASCSTSSSWKDHGGRRHDPAQPDRGLDVNASPEETRRQIATCYHTRLPVYRDQMDEIVGVLHIRSVLNLSKKMDQLRPEI